MRLIDADALLKHKTDHDMISTHLIYNAPTVDAVPVEDHKIIVEKARREAYHSGYKQGRFDEFIEAQYGRGDYDIVPVCRCKDCLWHYGTICRRNNTMFWNDDDFCSYAEREEDGTI